MISFSGIDCGGKSTQIQKVYEYFRKNKKRCKIIHSRGGYTPFLEFVKNLFRRDKKSSKQEKAEYREKVYANTKKMRILLWFSILDLALYYGITFRIIELFGKTILADRYFWDSYIDFKLKFKGIDFEKWGVWKFAKKIHKKPKISIIYTIPAELSMYRSTLKDEPWPEDVETRRKRIDVYMQEIAKDRWMHVVDATPDIETVFEKTIEVISK